MAYHTNQTVSGGPGSSVLRNYFATELFHSAEAFKTDKPRKQPTSVSVNSHYEQTWYSNRARRQPKELKRETPTISTRRSKGILRVCSSTSRANDIHYLCIRVVVNAENISLPIFTPAERRSLNLCIRPCYLCSLAPSISGH